MTDTTPNPKALLFQKILQVQKQLVPLEKSGKNTFQKYAYSTAGDVLEPARQACNLHNLVINASVTSHNVEAGKACVVVTVTLTDPETGEFTSYSAPGYAENFSHEKGKPTGDKALYVAITGATKYAIRTLFCLPSEDDPERDRGNGSPTQYQRPLNGRYAASAVNKPTPTNDAHRQQLMEMSNAQIKRLGWTPQQGQAFLQQTFDKTSRNELTVSELEKFCQLLKEQQPASPPSSLNQQ